MSKEYIEFKEYLRQKLKGKFIHQRIVAVLPEAKDVDIEIKSQTQGLMYLEQVDQVDSLLTQPIAQ